MYFALILSCLFALESRHVKRKIRVEKYKKNRKRFLTKVVKKIAKDDDLDSELIIDYDSSDTEESAQRTAMAGVGIKASVLKDLYSSSSEDESNGSEKSGNERSWLRSLNQEDGDDDDDDNDDLYYTPKVIYCSRTHSQLNQFIQELKKTKYAQEIRVVSVGSRKMFCIHPHVSQIRSLQRMNEVCLDMKNKGSKQKTKRCNFYDVDSHKLFKDHALLKVRDVEELVSMGSRIEACPYYGSRRAVPHAQLITMPYSSLVHRQTRESLGVRSLKDCVVIVDEAHNLIDAVIQAHSVQLSLEHLTQVHGQLGRYFTKYKLKLKPKNQSRIKQVLTIMNNVRSFLERTMKDEASNSNSQQHQFEPMVDITSHTTSKLMKINDFLFKTQLDNVNMLTVVDFLERSELTRKLQGFAEKYEWTQQEDCSDGKVVRHQRRSRQPEYTGSDDGSSSQSAIHNFIAFLIALANQDKNGRIIHEFHSIEGRSNIRFVLLNPSVYFKDIVNEAKSVILTGGTMEPLDALIQQLFPDSSVIRHISPSSFDSQRTNPRVLTPKNDELIKKITLFQCDHVIPDDHLLPICVARGLSGKDFDFTFRSRSLPQTMNDLGELILAMCNIVPDGIVCFFPSYDYEQQIYNHWQQNGFIHRIEKRKKFFREPRNSSSIDCILQDYRLHVDNSFSIPRGGNRDGGIIGRTGSFLSCVIGGKMSEGINFSDGYGRLVIVVGLPYPNPNDVELREKMKYLDENQKNASTSGNAGIMKPSQEYYESLCMKAVNQSIGRSIRHAADYASILLVDRRYAWSKVRTRLPLWIKRRLVTQIDRNYDNNCGGGLSHTETIEGVREFFRGKSDLQQQMEEQRHQFL